MRFSMAVMLLVACGGGGESDAGRDAGLDPGDARVDAGSAECSGSDGDVCGDQPGLICLAGVCVPSACGDGFVDPARGEECDDENTVAFDGCDPPNCTYTCTENAQCDDGDACSGVESCGTSHRCEIGTPLDDAAPCTREGDGAGVCRAGVCVEPGCGNAVRESGEDCDDGNTVPADGCENDCTFSCTADEQCIDTDSCDGVERCDPTTHACADGPPRVCDDASPCTMNLCAAEVGCYFPLIDVDRDGHAPDSLGSCGDDCDDTRGDTYTGAQELCDERDQDCDGSPIPVTAPEWGLDCDGDGFPQSGGVRQRDCVAPAPVGGCMAWSSDLRTDCNDTNASIRPDADELCDTVDQNCDGMPFPPSARTWYEDCDGDGYTVDGARTEFACEAPAPSPCGGSWTTRSPTVGNVDCNDSRADAHPGGTEVCDDGIDQDCDGNPNPPTARTWYCDGDDDGYALASAMTASACAEPAASAGCAGWTTQAPTGSNIDCADDDRTRSPGATEMCDGIDQDCRTSGVTLDGESDLSAYPAAQVLTPGALYSSGDRFAMTWDTDFIYITIASAAFVTDEYAPFHLYVQASSAPFAGAATPSLGKEYSTWIPNLPFTPTHLIAVRRNTSVPYSGVYPAPAYDPVTRLFVLAVDEFVSLDRTTISVRLPRTDLGCAPYLRLAGHIVPEYPGMPVGRSGWTDTVPATHTPWMMSATGYYEIDLTGATSISSWRSL